MIRTLFEVLFESMTYALGLNSIVLASLSFTLVFGGCLLSVAIARIYRITYLK